MSGDMFNGLVVGAVILGATAFCIGFIIGWLVS
jgi:hypothetical protein